MMDDCQKYARRSVADMLVAQAHELIWKQKKKTQKTNSKINK